MQNRIWGKTRNSSYQQKSLVECLWIVGSFKPSVSIEHSYVFTDGAHL